MVNRLQKLIKNEHLFLFGARGTGKSTLTHKLFSEYKTLFINLLLEVDEEQFGKHPGQLSEHLKLNSYQYVIIDEIQKFPKLLDIIHSEIESKKKNKPYFILTGSSARKLKRDHANLLGGRAFSYSLFPFTHTELKNNFNLDQVLRFGSLPLIFKFDEAEKKEEFLRGYVRNYIKEEILVEQLLRKIEPFKDFLEVAAQMNGEIINYSKIARDVGVSDQTVRSFFEILEDTLIGFILPPFHRSIRKRQRESPKFYFFDTGVKRALCRELKLDLVRGSSAYGKCFEHFIILEIFRSCEYLKNDFRLSYLRTKDDAEIDLIIERPGQSDFLLEIKSTHKVSADDTRTISQLRAAWDKPTEAAVWSLDPVSKTIDGVNCYPWQEGFARLFAKALE
jgi:predicted AAA+ superfamily ATPase